MAATGHSVELVRLFGEMGSPDINAQNEMGFTALHIAAAAGDVEIVRCLVQCKGITKDICNACGVSFTFIFFHSISPKFTIALN